MAGTGIIVELRGRRTAFFLTERKYSLPPGLPLKSLYFSEDHYEWVSFYLQGIGGACILKYDPNLKTTCPVAHVSYFFDVSFT